MCLEAISLDRRVPTIEIKCFDSAPGNYDNFDLEYNLLSLTAKDGVYVRFELLNDDHLQVFSQDLIDSAYSTNTKNVVKLEVKRPAQI